MNDVVLDVSERKSFIHSDRWLFLLMLLSAVASLVAAFVLSVDALKILEEPGKALSCDINSFISCGTVAQTWQAHLLGFPNSFIGMICEPVVITIAIAGLSGTNFPRWFMFSAQVVYFLGLVFALWLFTQSAFVIGAFCPWCLLVTVGTTITFFTLLRYNIFHNNLYLSENMQNKFIFLAKVHLDLAISIILVLVIFAVILVKYGYLLF